MGKLKSYHFSLGNSSDGPIGYCARIKASSKKEAVEILKRVLPDEIALHATGDSDADNEAVEYIEAYTNADAITEADIDEVNDVEE